MANKILEGLLKQFGQQFLRQTFKNFPKELLEIFLRKFLKEQLLKETSESFVNPWRNFARDQWKNNNKGNFEGILNGHLGSISIISARFSDAFAQAIPEGSSRSVFKIITGMIF